MTFDCEAYGPNSGLDAGDCFMSPGTALFECQTERQCEVRMRQERQRIWQAIQRLSATDETWAGIARDIHHPEQILGGRLAPEEGDSSR